MSILAIILLLALVVLFTCVQTLYVEGMRLRSRDLPCLQHFKSVLEPRLNMRSEDGSLTFSLWKHTCLVMFGIVMLANVIDGGTLNFPVLGESALAAWLLMIFTAYLIPQILVRKTSGRWMVPLMAFYGGAALAIRPMLLALRFIHSLLDIANEESERSEPATSAENIEALITAGTEEGLIEEDDRKLIQSVVAFGDKVVREVMTPRPNMITIQADATLNALRELVVNEQYSRIPVYQTTIDDVIGFVHARDMFEVAESSRAGRKVRELMRPVRFVPEMKPVHDLMREMQQEGGHMVIVVDEYGNAAGLATMEDLVEVILGEIRDEHEPESDVRQDGQGGYIVSGNFDLARMADILNFKPGEDVESTTIGGLVMEWLGRVPLAGEAVERDGIRAEILASDEMRVEKVHLSKAAAPESDEAGADAPADQPRAETV